ncbi:hypothetical protein [Vibrio algivorus]|uniref:Response regulator n=1 Tax=Vibrio algivorus TaxID=1667024 RepID=A0A557PFS4_9VIBR|nr:hypothetical protein [Vibrio algivorus]TVO39520.1 hypothetical protein FOF44_02750 [Vibrio algivorus]
MNEELHFDNCLIVGNDQPSSEVMLNLVESLGLFENIDVSSSNNALLYLQANIVDLLIIRGSCCNVADVISQARLFGFSGKVVITFQEQGISFNNTIKSIADGYIDEHCAHEVIRSCIKAILQGYSVYPIDDDRKEIAA